MLTRNSANVLVDPANGFKVVKNDVALGDMAEKPTLIANMIQYAPANLALNLMDGSNAEKGDILYDWRGRSL